MSKVKIPLKWYSDLIKIPGTDNEFVLLEWFEDEDCKTKTLFCLGLYMRISYLKIDLDLVEKYSNYDLTMLVIDNLEDFVDLSLSVVEMNRNYFPSVYENAKYFGWFEDVSDEIVGEMII